MDLYLVKLEGHPDGWSNDFMQKVHVREHPLVSCCYSEVTFEERVKPVQERVQAVKQSPTYCSFTLNKQGSESCHFEQGLSLLFVTS